MILIPLLSLIVGVLLGALFAGPVGGTAGLYLAVACLAGVDTIFGGIRSTIEGKFHADIFITGFASNVVIAFFFAWLGDRIAVNLNLATALIFGTRIFTNLSLIRRYALTRLHDARERKRDQEQQQQQQAAQGAKAT